MLRYFFHVYDSTFVPDEDGSELADIYAAQAEAVSLTGSLLRDLGARFWDNGQWKLEVCSSDQKVLFSLTLTAAEPSRPD